MTERLYYKDSFLTEFDALVTDIQELSRTNGQSLWRVALDRSAFYPSGGGQPFDTGSLIATARSGAQLIAEILNVEEDENEEVWHHTMKPLPAGTRVRGNIDPGRRLDHVQQHSGQHLLSAAFFRISKVPTVSFHLGEMTSTIDLATDKLPEGTVERVEELANQVIAEDRPIAIRIVSRAQAEAWLAAGELHKLPPREGDIRIVEIRDFDRNACGGTHARSTGQIGSICVRNVEKVKQGLRVEFLCGLRAVRSSRRDFCRLAETAQQLSVELEAVPPAVARIQAEAKQKGKHLQHILAELAEYHAAAVIRQAPAEEGLRFICHHLNESNDLDEGYMKLLAGRIAMQAERTVALIVREAKSPEEAATLSMARSRDLNLDCGSILRKILMTHHGRGGGSKDMAQGSVSVEDRTSLLTEIIREVRITIADEKV